MAGSRILDDRDMIEFLRFRDDAVYSPAPQSWDLSRGELDPLALMIRPHGSSPHHSLALVLALTAIRASKPCSLVHITSSAPSMLIALGGENSLSNGLVRSGRDRPTVVLAAPRHQHEDDARDFVGERHRGQIELVFDGLALEHLARLFQSCCRI